MKFTVGDTVRITGNSTGHSFSVGDTCVIVERKLGRRSATAEKVGTYIRYHICDDDAELVSKVVRDEDTSADGEAGKPKEIPYSKRLAIAQMLKNQSASDEVICKAFEDMAHSLMAVVNGYDVSDLPFVVATMTITANTMRGILPEGGKGLVDTLVSHSRTVAVNLEELKKQAREEKDERE